MLGAYGAVMDATAARAMCREIETLEARMAELIPARKAALEALVAAGWTQRQIAADLGISQPRVSQLLNSR